MEKTYYVIQNKNGKFFKTDSMSGGYPSFIDSFERCDRYYSFEQAELFLKSPYVTETFPREFNDAVIQKVIVRLESVASDMKIYKVKLDIDTGYTWYEKVCILYAANECDAKDRASNYINNHLHGETFADVKSVTEIVVEDNVIYQDCCKI